MAGRFATDLSETWAAGENTEKENHMTPTISSLGLDKLSREDRLVLVQELWDSIAAEGPSSLSAGRRDELLRRSAEVDSDPDDGISWEELQTKARALFRS